MVGGRRNSICMMKHISMLARTQIRLRDVMTVMSDKIDKIGTWGNGNYSLALYSDGSAEIYKAIRPKFKIELNPDEVWDVYHTIGSEMPDRMHVTLELISRYKEIDEEIGQLFKQAREAGHRVSWGNITPPLREIGKEEEYLNLYKEQDKLLECLGIHRYWENFGDDGTSEVIDMIEMVIKKFHNPQGGKE